MTLSRRTSRVTWGGDSPYRSGGQPPESGIVEIQLRVEVVCFRYDGLRCKSPREPLFR
jgi:hypothetical protein